jgi:protein TonB
VSAALSMVLQCSVLGVAVLIPLWFTDALPKQEFFTLLVAPPPPPPPPPAPAARMVQRVMTEIVGGQLHVPGRIPNKVQMIREEEPAPTSGVVGGVPGGIPGGQLGGVIGGILSSAANVSPVPKLSASAVPQRIRISQGVTKGQLIEKVEAKYPAIALSARIQGEVLLKAIISKSGDIENLEQVSGHPMLVPAALDAVKQWKYKPFLLNGLPVEVETMVTVRFRIAQ